MAYRVGVDIGGTFTDFCAFNEATDDLYTLKVLSRPDEPGAEVIEGIQQLEARFGIPPSEIRYFTHGTTVGINTVIQRKGIALGLITTEHFVDVLEVARLKMPDPYDLHSKRPEPLITKDRVFPVRERMNADGSVDASVDADSVAVAVARAQAAGVDGLVVSLINAYRNPAHEHQIKALIHRLAPELHVYCATDVWSIIREYERTVTAVIHGYVQPRVSHYLTSLQEALKALQVPAEPFVTKSNGGVMRAELGKIACAQMLLSGTASGVIGASFIARLSGFEKTMSLDIGGTSADVAFIENGMPQYGLGEVIGEFPIYIPTVAVTSIGAGGGSIAWVDDLGVLKVGPESAGSPPGPACYGHGGTRPTITDAFVVLGFIGQVDLGYNTIQIDAEQARRAVGSLATRLDLSMVETAEAIVNIAVSNMYMEVSKLISKYGIDPRDYALQAFGGAGPMLVCFLGAELRAPYVLVPPTPGVLSALGGLIADIKNDFITTIYADLEAETLPVVRGAYEQLEQQATAWLHDEQGYTGAYTLIYTADMRYRGQSFEIEVQLDATWVAQGNLGAIAEAFHQQHERLYEYADHQAEVQLITLRLVIVGESPKPHFPPRPETATPPQAMQHLDVHLGGTQCSIPLYDRRDLQPGQQFAGPVVISQSDCTTCVPDGFHGRIDTYGNLVLQLQTDH